MPVLSISSADRLLCAGQQHDDGGHQQALHTGVPKPFDVIDPFEPLDQGDSHRGDVLLHRKRNSMKSVQLQVDESAREWFVEEV